MLHQRYGLRYDDGVPHQLYTNYINYIGGLVCGPHELVYDITFEECSKEEQEMVAWRYKDQTDVNFIFKNRTLLSVCFPYGLDAAIKAGQGDIVYLKEVSSKLCSEAKDLKNHRADWDV